MTHGLALPPIALLFDLDGTLVDSLPDLAASLNALLAEAGRHTLSESAVAAMVGNGVEKLVERGWAATGPVAGDQLKTLTQRFRQLYERDPVAHTRVYDGVIPVLDYFHHHHHPMAVVTNKPEAPALVILKRLGLRRFFSVVIGGDSTPYLKPDPAPLQEAMARLGVSPLGDPQAIMIGDSRADVAAARAAGIPVIVTATGYRSESFHALGADRTITTFADLPDAVATCLMAGFLPG